MTTVEVEGRRVRLSNLDKVFYPQAGATKAQVVDYYARVGPTMLPHLAGRAVTLVRYPDGVEGPSFFEKRCPPHHPEWVRTAPSEPDLVQCVLDDLPSLVWVANLAAIELHTLQARVEDSSRPTAMVFDLDPGPPAAILDCCRVGLALRHVLEDLGLESVAKTTGSKGLHLAVPLNTPASADGTKSVARARAAAGKARPEASHDRHEEGAAAREGVRGLEPERPTQDHGMRLLLSRAGPRPTVSTPITWDEVSDALDTGDEDSLTFETDDVLDRVERVGDLYARNLELEQELPELQ